MNINEAVYRAIARGADRHSVSPASEGSPPSDVGGLVAELRRTLGTTPPPGVSERTWRRARNAPSWSPTPRVRDAMRDTAAAARRRARLSAGREAWLRHPAAVGWSGKSRVSSDTRERRILVSEWDSWSPGYPGQMVDDFLGRRDDQLGDPIIATLAGDVSGFEVLDTIEVRFFQTFGEADGWRRA